MMLKCLLSYNEFDPIELVEGKPITEETVEYKKYTLKDKRRKQILSVLKNITQL